MYMNYPLIADRVHRVYLQTKRALSADPKFKGEPWRVFLTGIDTPTKNDEAMAKKQYDYVFAG